MAKHPAASEVDDRRLDVIHQEEKADGRQSCFFRLANPEREDA